MSSAITTLIDASAVAAAEQIYFKKLSHAAQKQREHLDTAAKYGSVVRAGVMAVANGDMDQARAVDSMFKLTAKGRVALADKDAFRRAKPTQLCDFLAIHDRPAPAATKASKLHQIWDLTDDEPSGSPAKRRAGALEDA